MANKGVLRATSELESEFGVEFFGFVLYFSSKEHRESGTF